MNLPTFHNSQQAINFGLLATEEEREALRERRELTIAEGHVFGLKGQTQEAINRFTAAQFDREALEAQPLA
jgi:hypothetical protein